MGSAVATLMGVPFWLPLVAGGAVYALSDRPNIAIWIGLGRARYRARCRAAFPFGAEDRSCGSYQQRAFHGALFLTGLKGGLLTFGGAYTAFPYVRRIRWAETG